jgi:GABA(A) receptor-associated protein
MKEMSPFKRANSIDKRLKESSRVLEKFPDRIPVICEPGSNSQNVNLPKMDKSKFLVPKDLSIAHFVMIVRGRLKVGPEVALFFVVGDVIASSTSTMNNLYHEHCDADGFLYLNYSQENTFGW